MELKTILINTLVTVLIAVIPLVGRLLILKLQLQIRKIEDEKLRCRIEDATIAVYNAVSEVAQTFVDNAKDLNVFNLEEQKEAFNMAKTKAKELINKNSVDAINIVHKDFETWLNNQIESATKQLKGK